MKKYYEYWNVVNTPDELPEGAEFLSNDFTWKKAKLTPKFWSDKHFSHYRWPVEEHIWRTNRFCETFDIDLIEYEPIAFRYPQKGDLYLGIPGNVCEVMYDTVIGSGKRPILRRKDEWVTPTDEDAKLRPECEVWDYRKDQWVNSGEKLVFVDERKSDEERRFYVTTGSSYYKCRVKKSELERLREEKGGE